MSIDGLEKYSSGELRREVVQTQVDDVSSALGAIAILCTLICRLESRVRDLEAKVEQLMPPDANPYLLSGDELERTATSGRNRL